jgi:hypothetical protein
MKRPFITYLVLILSVVLISNDTALAKPPFIGVFSSKGGNGLYGLTLMLNDDGKGIIGPGPFLWKLGPATNQITLTGSFAGNPQKADSATVVFDPEKKEIRFLDEKLYHGESLFRNQTFYYTTNQIPKWLHNHLLHFNGTEWSLTHGCNDTIFALSVTNHLVDLHKLEQAIRNEGLYCRFNTGIAGDKINFLAVDERDVALARDYSTDQIVQSLLSIKVRKSGGKNVFEIWENGKKSGEEHFENGKPVPTWIRP